MATAITMTELAELILIKLYEISTAGKNYIPQDINRISASFGVFDDGKTLKAANFLKNNNLIELPAISEDLTKILGYINEVGEHYLDLGGTTGIIPRYKSNPSTFHIETFINYEHVTGSNIATNSPNAFQSIDSNVKVNEMLNQIESTLKNDKAIDETTREDALIDVNTLKAQLSKKKKNFELIKSILATLASISSITQLVYRLGEYYNLF